MDDENKKSIYDDITDIIDLLRELSRADGDESINDANILKSRLLELIPQLDNIRNRSNEDLKRDQDRIVELENDIVQRDNRISELLNANADLVSRTRAFTIDNLDKLRDNPAEKREKYEDIIDSLIKEVK